MSIAAGMSRSSVTFGRRSEITYGSPTRRLNCDVSPQQVGADISRNPLCILIPCHRVVGSNGKLTGYAGGLERKRALLELEQLTLGPTAHEALVSVGR
jgi:methylated-DNA-[protein]-cysteine S-methyltransferase